MKTYYRLYDKQTGNYMATGYNTESKEELIDAYANYKSVDYDDEDDWYTHWNAMTMEQKIDYIESDEFEIETSDKPFEEQKEKNPCPYGHKDTACEVCGKCIYCDCKCGHGV